MTITNGYCTLVEIRDHLTIGKRYTSTGIAFVDGGASADTITDTALGLEMFPTAARITVSGSTSNDGTYTIVTGDVAGTITLATATLTDEAAGDTVTITDVTDVEDDMRLEVIVEAVSRAIDTITGTWFYATSAAARYYTAGGRNGDSSYLFLPDDFLTITAVATDEDEDGTYENDWAVTDWRAFPLNYAADGRPIRYLKIKADGDYSWPVGSEAGVKITGTCGYCTAANQPVQIKQACLMLAAQVFKRKDIIFGTTVTTPLGQVEIIARDDPQIIMLLQGPWVRSF